MSAESVEDLRSRLRVYLSDLDETIIQLGRVADLERRLRDLTPTGQALGLLKERDETIARLTTQRDGAREEVKALEETNRDLRAHFEASIARLMAERDEAQKLAGDCHDVIARQKGEIEAWQCATIGVLTDAGHFLPTTGPLQQPVHSKIKALVDERDAATDEIRRLREVDVELCQAKTKIVALSDRLREIAAIVASP